MTQKPIFLDRIFTLRNLRSMGAAALIEIAIALGIAGILIWQQLHLVITPQPEPTPIVDFSQQLPILPRTVPVPLQPQAPQLSEVQPVQETIPSLTASPLQPLLPPELPVQPSRPTGSQAAEFSASMLRAINDQKVYPKEALLKGETGEAVVSFDYSDGLVSNIHVDRSSGSHGLDEAAVQAVRRAALPPKPAGLANLNHFVFHLAFDLGG